jgi:hypothetical protein
MRVGVGVRVRERVGGVRGKPSSPQLLYLIRLHPSVKSILLKNLHKIISKLGPKVNGDGLKRM